MPSTIAGTRRRCAGRDRRSMTTSVHRRWPAPLGLRFARSGAAPRRLFPGPRLGEPRSRTNRRRSVTPTAVVKDDLTHRLQAAATQWRDVIGMSDQQLAEQIRADRHRHPFRPGRTHGPQPPAGLRPQAGADPGDLGRLCGHHRADGDGLPAGRPLRGPAGRRAALSGAGAANARRLRLL